MPIKEIFVLALMVMAAVCIPVFGQTTGRDWIDIGNDLYAQGNYTGAIKALDKAVDAPDGWNVTTAYLMKVDAFLRGAASNKSYTMTVQEFLNISKNDTRWVIVDIREPREYLNGHIKGAMNIPSTKLIAYMKNIPKGNKVAVYCASNKRSPYGVMTLRIFDDRDAWILLDGVSAWKAAGQPIESGST
jgi:rhodanese-related sulfurtransferase